MKLTPLDLRKQQFRKVFRGYDPDEVRGFVEKLAQDWDEALEEKRRAEERVVQAEAKLRHYEKVELALQEALEAARETGRRAEGAAHQRAKLIVEEAELRAQRVVQDAEQERYNVRQDLVKLNSRQSEIAARLRAFLLSEMEILAQFQGDDPTGFIKLVAATDPAAGVLSGPRARLGAAVPEPEEDEAAPPPVAPPLGASEETPARAESIESIEAEAEAAPEVADGASSDGSPSDETPSVTEPPAPSFEATEAEALAAPVTASAPEETPPPSPPAAPQDEEQPAEPSPRPAAMPTYRDWLSGLAARQQRAQEAPPQTAEREREVLPFGRTFFRPFVSPEPASPVPEPAPGSDAAQGWSLRSVVTGDRESEPPSVVASEDERERIRRILEDLD